MGEIVKEIPEPVQHRRGDCVQRVGPIERDGRSGAVAGEEDVVGSEVGHVCIIQLSGGVNVIGLRSRRPTTSCFQAGRSYEHEGQADCHQSATDDDNWLSGARRAETRRNE